MNTRGKERDLQPNAWPQILREEAQPQLTRGHLQTLSVHLSVKHEHDKWSGKFVKREPLRIISNSRREQGIELPSNDGSGCCRPHLS